MYIVELFTGCWLASWSGDPGRTLVMDNAKSYNSESDAKKALTNARKYRQFPNAKIVEVKYSVK